MTDGLRRFQPADESPASWRRYCAFQRTVALESRPEDSPQPAELIEAGLKREEPDTIRRHFVLEREDAVIASLTLDSSRPGSPEYPSNRHLLGVNGGVLPGFRRQGVARSWLGRLGGAMDEVGATVWTAYVELESGHRFLDAVGARKVFSGHENRLRMADVDWALMDGWSRIEAGYRLDLYEPRLPESLFEVFCPAYTELGRAVPMEDMDHGEWILSPETLRDNYARMDVEGSAHHCLVASDEEGIVGITEYLQRPYQPELLIQELTAVHPRAQGRGLGKRLKGTLLVHARKLYPGVRFVVTENAGSNAPMLSINRRMGFRPYLAGSVYQMTRAELGGKL